MAINVYRVRAEVRLGFRSSIVTKTVLVEAVSTLQARRSAKREIQRVWGEVWTFEKISTELIGPVEEIVEGETYHTRIGTMVVLAIGQRRMSEGRFVVIENALGTLRTVTEEEFRAMLMPKETVEFWSVYPTGNVYKQAQPIKNSSYDLDDLVQLKITKCNGKIIKKEFV